MRIFTQLSILTAIFFSTACQTTQKNKTFKAASTTEKKSVRTAGAMKNVMWKGQLSDAVRIDSLTPRKGLYALGPGPRLRGEWLVLDGKSYWSLVAPDSSLKVFTDSTGVGAPFLVYGWQEQWQAQSLPDSVRELAQLETWIDQKMAAVKEPLIVRLEGQITRAQIHAQNLAPDAQVSSPKEAHAGQVNYQLKDQKVYIAGFFSRQHQGVFTHHDSYLHLHLLNAQKNMMGHLDQLEIDSMKVYLPAQYRPS